MSRQPSRLARTQLKSKYNPTFNLTQRLIGEEGARLLRDQQAIGRPRRSLQRGGFRPRPRKASTYSGDQPSMTNRAQSISIIGGNIYKKPKSQAVMGFFLVLVLD
ncbi:hypothetical protein [Heyndrickxia acidicola]|uniref:Uncharacterized protein n=1 Tax=Heyndrickxia acidicola TaxID=209389 RepID=A0ABU6MF31_9BACI|nr:hypothetical protein [Heyndrickxia acidicola]MED1203043.1 hypothetical protein [Heyndrickxia acidicola]